MLTFPKDSPVVQEMVRVGWRVVQEVDGQVTLVFGPANPIPDTEETPMGSR